MFLCFSKFTIIVKFYSQTAEVVYDFVFHHYNNKQVFCLIFPFEKTTTVVLDTLTCNLQVSQYDLIVSKAICNFSGDSAKNNSVIRAEQQVKLEK